MHGPPVVAQTTLVLTDSNVFMTLAWNAHPRNLDDTPWEAPRLDYLWAGLRLIGAVHYIFREPS
jgi:uncharacterized protein (DUF486 family)